MRNLGSLTASIVARHAAERAHLQAAHEAASAFHAAIARAIEAEGELNEADNPDRTYWQQQYQDALGAAAVALMATPVRWQAVLSCELDRIQSNVVPLKAAE